MDAEMTLLNLLQVLDENIEDYEMFAPDEILTANTDLLLHYMNHSVTVTLNKTKLKKQIGKVNSLIDVKDASKKY